MGVIFINPFTFTSSSGGGGSGGGSAVDGYNVTPCGESGTVFVQDDYFYGSPSVGDVIGYYDDQGDYFCGTVTSITTGSSVYEYDSEGFLDCGDCESYYGL